MIFLKTTIRNEELSSSIDIEKILKAKISQTEGCLPCLRAWVILEEPTDPKNLLFQNISLIDGDNVLFQGRTRDAICLPSSQFRNVILLKITPHISPSDIESSLKPIRAKLDRLLNTTSLPQETLSETCELIDYHRLEAYVGLNPLLPHTHDVRPVTPIPHTITRRYCRTPIETLSLTLSAEWIQKTHHTFDVGSALERAGKISSISGAYLEKSWPRLGDPFGATWMRVRSSRLTPKKTYEHALDSERSVAVQEYSPDLIVEWHSRQKRREILSFTLQGPTSTGRHVSLKYPLGQLCSEEGIPTWSSDIPYKKGEGVSYEGNIFLCLKKTKVPPSLSPEGDHIWQHLGSTNDVIAPCSSSFFPTHRGLSTSTHGLMKGLTYMEYSHRCIEIRCKLPFNEGINLHTFETIKIDDPHHGPFIGKVVSYTLTWLGDERFCEVSLEGLVNNITSDEINQWRENIAEFLKTTIDPEEETFSPPLFHDLIQKIQIENTAEDQIRQLSETKTGLIQGTALSVVFNAHYHQSIIEKKHHIPPLMWMR